MMNATDQRDYIIQGFKDLSKRLSGVDEDEAIRKRIRANTAAREREMNRVWREYAELGLTPPSDLALSITARRDMALRDGMEAGNGDEIDQARAAGV